MCKASGLDARGLAPAAMDDEAPSGNARTVLIIILILFAPLFAFLFLFNTVNAFQLLYVMSLRVVNRSSRPLWITPVGTFARGPKQVLPQFLLALPALPAFQERNHRVRLGCR